MYPHLLLIVRSVVSPLLVGLLTVFISVRYVTCIVTGIVVKEQNQFSSVSL